MAAPTLGTFKVALLAKIAGGEAHEIGELSIPITASSSTFVPGEGIRIDQHAMMLHLADALEQAAKSMRREHS